jgi:hypothetical protein
MRAASWLHRHVVPPFLLPGPPSAKVNRLYLGLTMAHLCPGHVFLWLTALKDPLFHPSTSRAKRSIAVGVHIFILHCKDQGIYSKI